MFLTPNFEAFSVSEIPQILQNTVVFPKQVYTKNVHLLLIK